MKKNITLICLFYLFSKMSFGQSDNLFFAISYSKIDIENTLKSDTRIPEFSIGYRKIRENGHYHQFAVHNIWFKNSAVENYDLSELQIGIQYTYNAQVWEITDGLSLLLGGSMGLEFYKLDQDPKSSIVFEKSIKETFLKFQGLAEIRYEIGEKWFVALDFPFFGVDYGSSIRRHENPALTEAQKERGGFNLRPDGFNEVQIGVGFRF